MNKAIFFLINTLFFLSCKREVVELPDFTVTANAASYRVGDTVRFSFTGNPHNIVFWSGKAGHMYEYRNRTLIDGNKLLIKFNTFQQYGVVTQNLSVYASDDFNGTYDTTNVKKATWKDITGKVTLSTGGDQTQSGTVDLTAADMFDGSKPIYVAFRYRSTNPPNNNRWVIRTFNADLQDASGATTSLATMATMGTAGWKSVGFSNPALNWSITTTQLLFERSVNAVDDDWVISRSFNSKATVPDKGEAIKNISFNLNAYAEVYDTPGTYKLLFEASNASYQNQERVIKEMTLTILP